MIEFADVWAGYGAPTSTRWVLKGLNLVVPSRERLVVMGSNGAGKSTLVNLLVSGGPSRGRISINGRDFTTVRTHERVAAVARLTQTPGESLADALSIAEHFALALARGRRRRMWGGVSREARRRGAECLERLRGDLPGRLEHRVSELSGGERQLVALALVMAAPPEILILDEPTSALDLTSQDVVQAAATALVGALGLTVLWVTHDPGEALRVGSRIVILESGAVAEDLNVSDLGADRRGKLAEAISRTMFRTGHRTHSAAEQPAALGAA